MKLVLDLDDTCTLTTQRIREVLIQNYPGRLAYERVDFDFKSMISGFNSEELKYLIWTKYRRDIFNVVTMPYVPELPEFLSLLDEHRIDLIIASANPCTSYVHEFVSARIKPFYKGETKVFCTWDKQNLEADVWIDDDPRILEKLDFTKRIFIKDMPYNRDFKQGIRINSLLECRQYL